MKLEFSRQIFEKSSNVKFLWKSFQREPSFFPCGRTKRHYEANSRFSQKCEKRLSVISQQILVLQLGIFSELRHSELVEAQVSCNVFVDICILPRRKRWLRPFRRALFVLIIMWNSYVMSEMHFCNFQVFD